ncbi:hypothetical protein [Ruegeria sp. HKCCD7255]|uniref:hypothetical protein n=1 Tax=Ruegeria sp. HKCCD7255 TaxID=2683004 RepID=UPI00148965F3|nr:hypothetical protein [Ruegeria sp. HKCCD7255]
MTIRNSLCLLLVCATPVQAQDIMSSIEMPAHRALMDQRGDADLTPFETDGCSGGLSSSWSLVADTFPKFSALYEAHPPWEYCCITHDKAYHSAGGALTAEDSFKARLNADEALRSCVKTHGQEFASDYAERYDMTEDQIGQVHSITAEAMFLAVRFGGGPCSGLPWRWGFGYPGCSVFPSREGARE